MTQTLARDWSGWMQSAQSWSSASNVYGAWGDAASDVGNEALAAGITWAPTSAAMIEAEAPQGFVQSIFSFFKQPQTQEAIRSAVQNYGPQVVDVASQMVENRGKGIDKLLKQLQRKSAAYARAKNPARRATLAAQIQTLRAQIAEIQRAQSAGQAALAAPLPPSTVIAGGQTPTWLPVLLIGGGAVIALTLFAVGARRRQNPRRRRRVIRVAP